MDHLVAVPVILPLAGAAVALLLRRRPRLQALWSVAVLVVAFGGAVALLGRVRGEGALVFQGGGWPAPFGISLVGDLLSATMTVMSLAVLVAGGLYALGSGDQAVRSPFFFPLLLTLTTGLTGALLTGDVFNLFVFAELLVVSGTVLTASADDPNGVEAAYKYFLISLFAGVLLLVASGCLYASYGTLNMADLARLIALDPDRPLVPMAMVCLLAFFAVKSAVVPFHFWQPDFHAAAPTAVSALLSSVVVKLGVYGFLRMTTLLFVEQAAAIERTLVVLGVAGLLVGGFGATGTHNAKRMLAYSTLAQIGFILIAVGWGTPPALAAAIVFAVNHALLKAALLMLAGAIASRTTAKSAAFAAVVGVGRAAPFAGALFLLGGLGLVGIPPTNGFVSKLALFQSGVAAERFPSLAVAAAAGAITLIYVGRSFQLIWWEPLPAGTELKATGDRLVAPALLIAACLGLGLWAEPLLRLAGDTSAWLGDPAAYVEAVLGPADG